MLEQLFSPLGPEKSAVREIDLEFHEREFERLRGVLEDAHRASSLPEVPMGWRALNDLLIRLRLTTIKTS